MLITTGGAFSLWVILHSQEHQERIGISATRAADYLRRLETEQFLFHPIGEEHVRALDGVEAEYGQTYLTERFVRAEWSEHVRVVGYVPGSLSLYQDFVVLEKVS